MVNCPLSDDDSQRWQTIRPGKLMPSYMTDSEKLLASPRAQALSVKCVSADGLAASLGVLSPAQRSFPEATGFKAQAGRLLLLPDASGKPELALLGMGSDPDPMLAGRLPAELPEGTYRLEDAPEPELAAFAFLAGAYRFSRYRKSDAAKVRRHPWAVRDELSPHHSFGSG